MKNHSSKLLALAGAVLLSCGFIAANKPADSKRYDYLSIVQVDDELHISGSQHPFEKVKFKEKAKLTDCSYVELFQKVNEFEAQGYELTENNVYTLGQGAISRNYMLLRKPK